MSAPAAAPPIVEEESTDNHWIGSCGDLVLIFAYEGSHDDIRHVTTGAAVVERLHRERGGLQKLLFALPPRHAKPPSAKVRAAIVQVSRRLEGLLSKVAVVVAGSGFGAAVHRGAVTGVMAILRPKIPLKVEGSFREGLATLVDAQSPAMSALLLLCEERCVHKAPPSV